MKYEGNDNYGRPKSLYLKEIANMSDDTLEDETYWMIYHSTRCANNHEADWHWKCDACRDESNKRGGEIYKKAYEEYLDDYAPYRG